MTTQSALRIELTAAIAIDGEVIKPGEVVEVTVREGKNLLRRGKGFAIDPVPEKSGPVGTAKGGAKRQGQAPEDER